MLFSYAKLSHKPRVFRKLTGLSLEEFGKILALTDKALNEAFPKIGRRRRITSNADRIILLMLYYRAYVTHEFIGYLVDLDETNICRLFARIEPILAKYLPLKKDRTLTENHVLHLLTDATEQPIQRPKRKKDRKKYYSGKKKQHTQKIEMTMTSEGEIIMVSKSVHGRMHDKNLRDQSDPLPRDVKKYADLGYQGWQAQASGVILPHKKPKGGTLTPEQKAENKAHRQIRIIIEHKFSQLKKFRILGTLYRNFRKKHHLRFNIIAGIVNLQAGF